MTFTLIDIINLLIEIENKAISIYETIVDNANADSKLVSVAKILIIEERRHIENYEKLIMDIKTQEGIELDLSTYNEISSLYFEFNKNFKAISAKTIFELLKYAIDVEKLNINLLVKIQKLFGSIKSNKAYKKSHEVVTDLLEVERTHVRNLFVFIKAPG